MEIQANLAYDIFYTKMWLILEKKVGSILHVVSLCSELTALVLWVLVDKQRFFLVDVRLTNSLVLGGIVVDVLSCFKLIFSDAMIPKLARLKWVGDSYILNKALMLKRHEFWSRWLMIGRWSGTIPQSNWIQDLILKPSRQKRMNWAMMSVVNYLIHPIQSVKLSDDVKGCVFNNIKYARLNYDNAERRGVGRFSDTIEDEELKRVLDTIEDKELGKSNYYKRVTKHDVARLDFLMKKYHMRKDLESILKSAQLVDSVLFFHLATELLCKEDLGYRTDVAKQVSEYLMYYLFNENNSMLAQGMIREVLTASPSEIIYRVYMGKDESERDLDFQIRAEAASKSELMIAHAQHIKSHLMGLEKKVATAIVEDMWVGLVCSTAIQSTGRAHLERLRVSYHGVVIIDKCRTKHQYGLPYVFLILKIDDAITI